MSNVFSTRLQELLHRGATVAHNSGGEPAEIPDLSYDELRQFHATRYHPSNALIFSYGTVPLRHVKLVLVGQCSHPVTVLL